MDPYIDNDLLSQAFAHRGRDPVPGISLKIRSPFLHAASWAGGYRGKKPAHHGKEKEGHELGEHL